MRISYRPFVQPDLTNILRDCDTISPRLGDEFREDYFDLNGFESILPHGEGPDGAPRVIEPEPFDEQGMVDVPDRQ